MPNFDKISQSTTEINYFRLRKMDGRHIGILFPVSNLTIRSHRHVILHLPAKFRSNRTIHGGLMTPYRIFKMAASSRKSTPGFRFSDSLCL